MAFPCIYKGLFLIKSAFKSTYCKCFCTYLIHLVCRNSCKVMAWKYMFFTLLVLTLHEGRMGFSSMLKKVRYAVLISHIGGPIPKDILKILTRIFQEGKKCLQLQAWKHTVFRERQMYWRNHQEEQWLNSCNCKTECTSVNSIIVCVKHSSAEHLFLYPCGEGNV